jgi:universal stress protein E
MIKSEMILVAVDPSRKHHTALERVIFNARLSTVKPLLHLFIAVDTGANRQYASSLNAYLSLTSIHKLIQSVKDEGLECECELYWAENWQEDMLATAKRIKADLIVMTDHSNVGSNIFLADSKWALLRQAKRPVMLVRIGASDLREKVLAAVNMQADDELHQALNQRILENAKLMAEHYGAELHVVNAYRESINYPDRGGLVRKAVTDSSFVHVQQGSAEYVVAQVADEINADIVVIGTMAKKGFMEFIRGSTSERVLNRLQRHDILTIN